MSRKVYSNRRWDKVRRRRLFLAGYKCERCHRYKPLQVHHKIMLAHGGPPFDIDNTEALCRACHEDEHKLSPKKIRSSASGKCSDSAEKWKAYLKEKSAVSAKTE